MCRLDCEDSLVCRVLVARHAVKHQHLHHQRGVIHSATNIQRSWEQLQQHCSHAVQQYRLCAGLSEALNAAFMTALLRRWTALQ